MSITGDLEKNYKLTPDDWIELLKTEDRVYEVKIRLISENEVRIVFDKAWSRPNNKWLNKQISQFNLDHCLL